MLIDTHCHIHEPYQLPINEVIDRARQAGVEKYVCVGTSIDSSRQAIEFAASHDGAYASIGVHPHDTKAGYEPVASLIKAASKLVAIGEIGLDYFYTNSPRAVQLEALRFQLQLAVDHDLPVIFHVRNAFEDFWPVFDSFTGLRGVLHSFTDSQTNLAQAVRRGLYIGVNGISTFTKDDAQKAMFDAIPLDRLLIETDAPFLTPAPYRGKINEPAYCEVIARYHAEHRGIPYEEFADQTSRNAYTLLTLS